jgi:hypothetical protein
MHDDQTNPGLPGQVDGTGHAAIPFPPAGKRNHRGVGRKELHTLGLGNLPHRLPAAYGSFGIYDQLHAIESRLPGPAKGLAQGIGIEGPGRQTKFQTKRPPT